MFKVHPSGELRGPHGDEPAPTWEENPHAINSRQAAAATNHSKTVGPTWKTATIQGDWETGFFPRILCQRHTQQKGEAPGETKFVQTKFGQDQVWPDQVWPRPCLARQSLAKSKFGQTKFGQVGHMLTETFWKVKNEGSTRKMRKRENKQFPERGKISLPQGKEHENAKWRVVKGGRPNVERVWGAAGWGAGGWGQSM